MGLTQVSKDGVKNDAIDASKLPANSVGASELADNAVDTNAIADDAVGADQLASNAVVTASIADNAITQAKINVPISNRNLIINGAMQVAQRGTSFNQAGDGSYTLDRFAAFRNGAGIMDIEQSTTVPSGEGFKKSLKCTVDTADSSLGGTDFGGLFYKIEGQDINQFEFGSSSAKQFTLSFFVRSNITGTYSVALRNGSANRYLVKEYTISSADTWQKITITDTADLTGTWASDNTTGLQINWCLWEGGFSAAPNTWGSNNIIGSINNVNWVATVGNTFYLTGVQLEVGSVATDFEHRLFVQELASCKRYFQQYPETASDGFAAFGTGAVTSATQAHFAPTYPTMRAAPTVALSGNSRFVSSGSAKSVTSLQTFHAAASSFFLGVNVASGLTVGNAGIFGADNDSTAKLTFSAEL